nr:BREX-1 system adenine-specific DNA-methyltransferase PglX [Actinomycetota bacterium]
DARCTQIAAFSLALQAWKAGGYRELPIPNVACSGIPAGGRVEEWTRLAGGDFRLENALRRLHGLFRNAPDLGSLIDPSRVAEGKAFGRTGTTEMDVADLEEVETLLEKALARERNGDDPTAAVFGEAARGIARAAALQRGRYHLVATNVPYLTRGKQGDTLKDHLETYHSAGKADLATAFVQRCADYCATGGSYALVTPQNWLFLGSYKKLRERLLKTQSWNLIVRLGARAFETIGGEVVSVTLLTLNNTSPADDRLMTGLDVSNRKTPAEKDRALREAEVVTLPQAGQLENPDARVTLLEHSTLALLKEYATATEGLSTGDRDRFVQYFWEQESIEKSWEFLQTGTEDEVSFSGTSQIFRWEEGKGELSTSESARIQGHAAWGKNGVLVARVRSLRSSRFSGTKFDKSCVALIPRNSRVLPALWAFSKTANFTTEIRKLDKKPYVTTSTFLGIPFDLERWQKVAEEKYPDGLPEPYSDDPTQWLFHGHPAQSTAPLQVTVARLLGYRWPAETDEEMELPDEARAWISRCDELAPFTDPDGIVCLPAVAGEQPAAERLRALLAKAYGEEWSPGFLDRLLAGADHGGKDLHTWLRDKFFAQHARLFHNRPFVWHVWDGRKDGFSALVNYHSLDGAKLRRLIYTYLGSYIEAQTTAARSGTTGADLRLAAAQELKAKLEAILHGEPPYDIYVRWKGLHEQAIGWERNLNDGVRLNIRPFVEVGVLRSKFTIHWNKDRGKNPDGSERHNALNLTRAVKEEARRKVEATRGKA